VSERPGEPGDGAALVCPVCEYEVGGPAGSVCPECGTALTVELLSRHRTQPRGLLVVAAGAFVAAATLALTCVLFPLSVGAVWFGLLLLTEPWRFAGLSRGRRRALAAGVWMVALAVPGAVVGVVALL
jgi:hypothetical protein